jgi:DNA integrity scanning protein DisA with diadenylate cyclase activity
MKPQRFNEQFASIFDLAVQFATTTKADALLVLLEGPTDWEELKKRGGPARIVVAGDEPEELQGADQFGLATVVLHMEDASVLDRLTQAVLQCVVQGILERGARVVALFSGFDPGKIDSISFVRLEEHLGRLTTRDLRELAARVPLETLKAVVDLAVEIGREGREGKPVGTMFIVGDSRKVMANTHPAGFDPVKGYSRKDRSLHDRRTREGIKEIAQLDGAIVVAADGTVEAACRLVDSAPVELTLPKGLGSRHWAAAAISKNTKAIAVVVSESTGTVRIFRDGEVMLRIEPLRRPLKWKDFEFEPPASDASKALGSERAPRPDRADGRT